LLRKDVKVIRIGVIGCGTVCQLIHLPILTSMDDVYVAILCDVNEFRLHMAQRRFHVSLATKAASDVTALPDVDAVLIATDDVSHFDLVMMALKNGKHVFVEKPLCLLPEQSDIIMEHAVKLGLIVAVGLQKLFDRSLGWLIESQLVSDDTFLVSVRDICHDNDLVISAVAPEEQQSAEFLSGRTDYADSQEWHSIVNQWYPGCPEDLAKTYRVFLNLACHDLSLVIRLFGEPTGVAYAEFSSDQTRRSLVVYELAVGGRCVVEAALTSRSWFDESIRIYTPTSTALVEWPSPFRLDAQSRAEVMRMTEYGVETRSYQSHAGTAFSDELRCFVRAVGSGQIVPNSVEHASAVLRSQVNAIRTDVSRRLRGLSPDSA
jgi:predicted dehydrogenase